MIETALRAHYAKPGVRWMQEQTGEPQRCIMNLSDGEKFVLMVLADMYKHLEIKGEFDPDFISTTISGAICGASDGSTRTFHLNRRKTRPR